MVIIYFLARINDIAYDSTLWHKLEGQYQKKKERNLLLLMCSNNRIDKLLYTVKVQEHILIDCILMREREEE